MIDTQSVDTQDDAYLMQLVQAHDTDIAEFGRMANSEWKRESLQILHDERQNVLNRINNTIK